MSETITLSHGSGGKMTDRLIHEVFLARFGYDGILTDSAIIKNHGPLLALTTDSYVVDPIFFPGGDIGRMAVCGTVNDLAVSGALPCCLTASFIIEEGFAFADLIRIVNSMASEAENAGVKIVAGDTKVVGKGKCDKIFINTSGIGFLDPNYEHIGKAARIKTGDRNIINGPIGNHSIAVLGARNELGFRTHVLSDCASLNGMIQTVLAGNPRIGFMRDITRGGLGTILNELASSAGCGIEINEESIPVDGQVRGICEILGFDPLYLANEGKVIIVAGDECCEEILRTMKQDPLGAESRIIGTIVNTNTEMVIMNTLTGGKRIVEYPSAMQLPRIC